MKLKYGILILVGISLTGFFVIGFDYGLPEEMWPGTIEISNSTGFVVIDVNPESFPANGTLIPHAIVDLPPISDQEVDKFGFNGMFKNLKIIPSVFVIIPKGAVVEGNISLIPEEITVVMGINNTITWINEDDTPHGITSDYGGEDGWASPGVLKPGESFSVTFSKSGIFPYHMEPHPWVTGTVIVLDS